MNDSLANAIVHELPVGTLSDHPATSSAPAKIRFFPASQPTKEDERLNKNLTPRTAKIPTGIKTRLLEIVSR